MDDSSDKRHSADLELRAAIVKDGPALVRFLAAQIADPESVKTTLATLFADAVRAVRTGDDAAALTRAQLFSLARRRAAQRSPGEATRRSVVGEARPTERDALLLRYLAGFSFSDVARICGTSEGEAAKRASRGLARICDAREGSSGEARTGRRQDVEQSLADLVEGSAPKDLADFVADDDASRDLVHDAAQLIDRIKGAEADHRFDPEEVQRDVVALIAKTEQIVLRRETVPAETKAAPVADSPGRKAPAAAASQKNVVTPRFVGVALALVLGVGWLALRGTHSTSNVGLAWNGTVTDVERASASTSGLERCSPDRSVCSALERGDAVPAASVLRTDTGTRTSIRLNDGTHLVLDGASELSLDGERARSARLLRGKLVLDVAKQDGAAAHLDAPLGALSSDDGKFSVNVGAREVDLAVVRGTVRLVDGGEHAVAVHEGEEAELGQGQEPVVRQTSTFGRQLSWSEHEFQNQIATDGDPAGLGALSAQKPGEDKERKGAVSLSSHTTRVRIVGNVARTEIEETFTNGSNDVLEGIYRFPLPGDAQIERLALDVDGRLEEGAFVDRDRAASIWRGAIVNAGGQKRPDEEIVWVPGPWRDPALLEWQRGGKFELRIFPIPKHGSRRIVLAYTQLISPEGRSRRYVYPLSRDPSGTTRAGRFDVDVQIRGLDREKGIDVRGYAMRQDELSDGAVTLSFGADGFSPKGDLSVEYSLPNPDQEVTAWAYQPSPDEIAAERAAFSSTVPPSFEAGAPYAALALRPKLPRSEDRVFRDFALVVDSSRSMFGERYRRAVDLAARVVGEMDPDDRVTVLACDSTCREMPARLVAGGAASASAARTFLLGVVPEGGSDVAGAVAAGRTALGESPSGAGRVVYIGDGTPTIGPVEPAFLRREIEAVVPRTFGTVTTVAIGSDADSGTLRTIAEAGGGVVVPYAPGQNALDAAYAVLGATYGTVLRDPEIELPDGLVDAAPGRLGTIEGGGETILAVRMTRPSVDGTLVLRGKIGDVPFEQRYPVHVEATTAKGNAFVPRLWGAAKIADLESSPAFESRKQIVELSQRFHVASRYTSLMVLESPAMFRAFGITEATSQPTWTGDADATSTGSDGETALAEPEDKGAPGSPPSDTLDRARQAVVPSALGAIGESAGAMPQMAPKSAAASEKGRGGALDDAYDGASSRGYASPPPAPAPVAAAPLHNAFELGKKDEEPFPYETMPELPLPRRRMIPMRKVWDRIGHVIVPATTSNLSLDAVARAEADAASPDASRDAVKHLYTLYFLSGALERAGDVAERWSSKDPLDPDALTARADVAAARGNRDLSIRILGSVVDVRPGDYKAQWRLARLQRWAGRGELGCRHSMAVAQIRSTDAKLLSDAVRCARDLGHDTLAGDLMAAADEPVRNDAALLLAKAPADPSTLAGDLRVSATWDGGEDLDLSLLMSDGGRVSWLGAPTRAIITARDVESVGREGLALNGGAPGDYVVEITRPSGHSGPVRGMLEMTAAGERRTVPFVLSDARLRVATLRITTKSRLVPL